MEYVRGPDLGGGVGGMLYTLRPEGGTLAAKYSYANGRGDVVAQANQGGAVTWTASYEAFGTRKLETGTNVDRQRANTKEEDPTGLLNEGFRYRDLETGTWLSRDPAGFVDGPNLYAYVKCNPWTGWDPEGLADRQWGIVINDTYLGLDGGIRSADAWDKSDVYGGSHEFSFKQGSENLKSIASNPMRALQGFFAGSDGSRVGNTGERLGLIGALATRGGGRTQGASPTGGGPLVPALAGAGGAPGKGIPVRLERDTTARPLVLMNQKNESDGAKEKKGIYEFPDQKAGGTKYVGETNNFDRRLAQHEQAGRLKTGTETTTSIDGDKTAREIAEHKRIQEITGGAPAKQSDAVSNKKDPIGPKRQRLLKD